LTIPQKTYILLLFKYTEPRFCEGRM